MKRADQRKFHYIYKITRHDGKYYIGMHSTDDLDDGYFGSGQLLWKSIKKHGKEKHTKEILEFLPSRLELKMRERQLVNEETLDDPFCMNLKLGGEGGGKFKDEEHQQKCAKAGGLAGGSRTSWFRHREKISLAVSNELKRRHAAGEVKTSGMLGKKHTSASRWKMSESKSGRKNSQFGKVWVTNGSVSKTIPKSELLNLSIEWRLGRK